jgi:hypothetical protein
LFLKEENLAEGIKLNNIYRAEKETKGKKYTGQSKG